jgi:shikimate kinase
MAGMPTLESSRHSKLPSRIRLIGYRGTGKSAVAQALALRLGWDWVDADVELELRAGKSIAQIFSDDGEPAFRDLENAILAELAARERTVLATGGGVVMRAGNCKLLRDRAAVVWLKARPETILNRLSNDWTTVSRRPNLTTGGLDEIREMLDNRTPLYRECADFAVDTDEKTVAEVAGEILDQLPAPATDVDL